MMMMIRKKITLSNFETDVSIQIENMPASQFMQNAIIESTSMDFTFFSIEKMAEKYRMVYTIMELCSCHVRGITGRIKIVKIRVTRRIIPH
jgi:hypothetical protein